MTIMLFLLLTIIVIGLTILTYIYLLQEQKKFVSKNKESEAWEKMLENKQNSIKSFTPTLGQINSLTISFALGLLSSIAYCFIFFIHFHSIDLRFLELIIFMGSIASLIGFSIGMIGAFQRSSETSFMKYGGILFSIIGFGNIHLGISGLLNDPMIVSMFFNFLHCLEGGTCK